MPEAMLHRMTRDGILRCAQRGGGRIIYVCDEKVKLLSTYTLAMHAVFINRVHSKKSAGYYT